MILFVDTTEKIIKLGLICHPERSEGSRRLDSSAKPQNDTFIEFEGGRELDSLILVKIEEVLNRSGISSLRGARGDAAISGIIANTGPGSFTGLRIGLSVVNALGYGLNIPVVGIAGEKDEKKIIEKGISEIKNMTKFEKPVVAEYGTEPNITKPKDK